MPVTCVYKHIDEVTRRTVEDVTEVVDSDNNIISDDQLSSVENKSYILYLLDLFINFNYVIVTIVTWRLR